MRRRAAEEEAATSVGGLEGTVRVESPDADAFRWRLELPGPVTRWRGPSPRAQAVAARWVPIRRNASTRGAGGTAGDMTCEA